MTIVPAMLILGKKEAENGTVTIRRLGEKNQESLALKDALATLKRAAAPPVAL